MSSNSTLLHIINLRCHLPLISIFCDIYLCNPGHSSWKKQKKRRIALHSNLLGRFPNSTFICGYTYINGLMHAPSSDVIFSSTSDSIQDVAQTFRRWASVWPQFLRSRLTKENLPPLINSELIGGSRMP